MTHDTDHVEPRLCNILSLITGLRSGHTNGNSSSMFDDEELYHKQKNKFFEPLMKSGFDFLQRSVSDFEKSPKFSMVNFAIAIELILKSRLLCEHWALIFSNPKSADKSKLEDGSAHTVDAKECMSRINRITDAPISDKAEKTFSEIINHRNKMVHFVHGSDGAIDQTDKSVQEIVSEQCRGWMELYRLLKTTWRSEFAEFRNEIENINRTMNRHARYLSEKFDLAKPDIDKHIALGGKILDCQSCQHASLLYEDGKKNVYDSHCVVCEYRGIVVAIECETDKCHQRIVFQSYDGPPKYCASCKNPISEEHIKNNLDTSDPVTKDNYFERGPLSCGHCSSHSSVIEHHDMYVCMSCFEQGENTGMCEYCGEVQIGEISDYSYLSGCAFCDGSIANMRD